MLTSHRTSESRSLRIAGHHNYASLLQALFLYSKTLGILICAADGGYDGQVPPTLCRLRLGFRNRTGQRPGRVRMTSVPQYNVEQQYRHRSVLGLPQNPVLPQPRINHGMWSAVCKVLGAHVDQGVAVAGIHIRQLQGVTQGSVGPHIANIVLQDPHSLVAERAPGKQPTNVLLLRSPLPDLASNMVIHCHV